MKAVIEPCSRSHKYPEERKGRAQGGFKKEGNTRKYTKQKKIFLKREEKIA